MRLLIQHQYTNDCGGVQDRDQNKEYHPCARVLDLGVAIDSTSLESSLRAPTMTHSS